jgi:ribosome-binding protein aMBF1 (putative translation factor)
MPPSPNPSKTLAGRAGNGSQFSLVGHAEKSEPAPQGRDVSLKKHVTTVSDPIPIKDQMTVWSRTQSSTASGLIEGQQPRGITMTQFEALMNFARETRDLQQKYLEAIKAENAALIERYRAENISLVEKIEKRLEKSFDRLDSNLATFRTETIGELGSVRRWYAGTIIAILLAALFGFGGIIYSIWATAR